MIWRGRNGKMNSNAKALLPLLVLVLAGSAGCRQERRFEGEKTDWFGWARGREAGEVSEGDTGPPRIAGNVFEVWVFTSGPEQEALEQAWSYLDELLPAQVKDWKTLNRNGLRCGIGRSEDWPLVKAALEESMTTTSRENPPLQISVGHMSSAILISDDFQKDRTLFYYDRAGRLRGEDGPSKLELVLGSPGRTGQGRVRVVFSPRVVEPPSPLRGAAERSVSGKSVARELENLSIVADLGLDEFALVGPTASDLPKSLIGSQLFVRWEDGERHTNLVLVKPVAEVPVVEDREGGEDG